MGSLMMTQAIALLPAYKSSPLQLDAFMQDVIIVTGKSWRITKPNAMISKTHEDLSTIQGFGNDCSIIHGS